MIKVYHREETSFVEMSHVANVDPSKAIPEGETIIDRLEFAFEQTNSHSHPWPENEAAECLKEARSTAVGDIFVDVATGGVYEVAGAGYNHLNSRVEAGYVTATVISDEGKLAKVVGNNWPASWAGRDIRNINANTDGTYRGLT